MSRDVYVSNIVMSRSLLMSLLLHLRPSVLSHCDLYVSMVHSGGASFCATL